MIKIGKKTKEWNRVRKELVKEFEEAGITQCEIRLEGCTKGLFLGFAHTKKRRDVTDLKRVVLSCTSCHEKIEFCCYRWTGMKMENYLEQIIRNRKEVNNE
jgi:hypothetical protein